MPQDLRTLLLSRRNFLNALGAVAIAQLPGCGSTEATIGYSDRLSYRPGERVTLFLSSRAPGPATLHLYDFAGVPVFEFTARLTDQAEIGPDAWQTGFGYQPSVTFTMPELPSGVYTVERLIPLVVKSQATRTPEIVVVYPSNTLAAYNTAGGRSLYSKPVPATAVSFHRPAWPTRDLQYVYSFLAWFWTLHLPYSFRYVADIDLDDYSEVTGSKLLLISGHSEYWTRAARENFDRFVREGGNVLLLSGNNMWWQVRYSTDRTQLICYKRALDPTTDPLLQTTNWPDYVLHYPVIPSIGGDFEHGGFKGAGFRVALPDSPVFNGVDVESGGLISMPTFEYDGTPLLNSPVTQGEPQLDLSALGAYRAELIGYAPCMSAESGTVPDRIGAWIAQQRSATSGIVINGGSTAWCSGTGVGGPDRLRVQQIILNMIDILVNSRPVFVT